MAELAILRQNQAGEMHRRGEVVVVKPDGHRWGKKERPPLFEIVKFPGEPVEAFAEYLEPQTAMIGGERTVIGRRKHKVDPDMAKTAKTRAALRNIRESVGVTFETRIR